MFVKQDQKPILYKGTGLTLSIYENCYQYTIASPEPECISKRDDGKAYGIGDTNQMVV